MFASRLARVAASCGVRRLPPQRATTACRGPRLAAAVCRPGSPGRAPRIHSKSPISRLARSPWPQPFLRRGTIHRARRTCLATCPPSAEREPAAAVAGPRIDVGGSAGLQACEKRSAFNGALALEFCGVEGAGEYARLLVHYPPHANGCLAPCGVRELPPPARNIGVPGTPACSRCLPPELAPACSSHPLKITNLPIGAPALASVAAASLFRRASFSWVCRRKGADRRRWKIDAGGSAGLQACEKRSAFNGALALEFCGVEGTGRTCSA
jgi:hypothetical protein